MDRFKKKWGLVTKAAIIVAPLVGLKALFHYFDLEVITVGPVVTALVAGVFFVIAIMLSGVLPDFKESERIPAELTAAIEALYKDARLIGPGPEALFMLSTVRELVHAMALNFERQGVWKLSEVNAIMDRIDDDILSFAQKGAPMPLIVKMRNELGSIKRMSNRIDVIKETTFLPAGHAIAEFATSGALLVLLLSKIGSYYEGMLLVGVVSTILVSVVLLIKDMDNPFEGHATVDLSLLHKLDEYLDSRSEKNGPL
jgi:hypothetical protein